MGHEEAAVGSSLGPYVLVASTAQPLVKHGVDVKVEPSLSQLVADMTALFGNDYRSRRVRISSATVAKSSCARWRFPSTYAVRPCTASIVMLALTPRWPSSMVTLGCFNSASMSWSSRETAATEPCWADMTRKRSASGRAKLAPHGRGKLGKIQRDCWAQWGSDAVLGSSSPGSVRIARRLRSHRAVVLAGDIAAKLAAFVEERRGLGGVLGRIRAFVV